VDNQFIFKKTRIAPTPSGYLHLGNILSFAITASLAARTGAKILLRIDDFDRERTNKLYVQDIFDTLDFLEIPWDEGPKNLKEYELEYSQVHREEIYKRALQQLKNSGRLFACTCSRAQVVTAGAESVYQGTCRNRNIPLDTENVCWRINTDHTKELEVKTLGGASKKAGLPPPMHDFIVRRKDGFPAYQLISVLDDIHFGVDLVVRGDDLWPSTLAQLYLASALGQKAFPDTTFYHHPLLINTNGEKLSKSEGDTSVHDLRKQHKKPADIYALIATMLGIKASVGSWQELAGLSGINF